MNHDLKIGDDLFGWLRASSFWATFCLKFPATWRCSTGRAALDHDSDDHLGRCLDCHSLCSRAALYLVLRFLLGSAEAGFYPGVILYLTFWLPPAVRSSVMAWFVTAIPLSNLIGAPVSNAIMLHVHGAGLHGWQWLFILEDRRRFCLDWQSISCYRTGRKK